MVCGNLQGWDVWQRLTQYCKAIILPLKFLKNNFFFKFQHVTPLEKSLQWLPVSLRIKYTILIMVTKA